MKHKLLSISVLIFFVIPVIAQNVGLGTSSPNASAALDITANNRGLLMPRMTTTARNNIAAPAKGLLVYDSTLGTFTFHNGSAWTELLHTGNNVWLKNGSNIYTPATNVGIGTNTPAFGLHVVNSNAADGGWAQGIVVENINDPASAGEAGISFRNTSFAAGKQWTIGLNQSAPLAFNFGTTFAGGNTRMVIDTIGRIGMGTTSPDSSAQLHLNSTSRGLIVPRMTTSQRNAINGPALGLLVFDTDKHTLYMFDGSDWVAFVQQAPGFVPVTLRTVDTIPQSSTDIGIESAVFGELAVANCRYDYNGLTNVGCVLVYKKNGGRWDYIQQVLPDIPQTQLLFGWSLALNDSLLVVGSPKWNTSLTDKGKVWYYKWNGTEFVFLDSLAISNGQANDQFGFSVALRGNTLVVGAPQENTNGNDAGGIYVYTFNPATNRFGNRVRLAAPNAKAGDKLGYAVDVDGSYVVAGAPFHPFGAGLNKGIAHVWTGSGTSWGYQDSCTYASANTPYERLGLYLSLSGSNLMCGANYNATILNSASAVYFKRSGNAWINTQEIKSDDNDNSFSVPIVMTRGNWMIVGNSDEDHLGVPKGNVWIYALESGIWVRKRRVYNYTTNDLTQRWADSLGFDGTTIVIGSYTYNNSQGAVFFTTPND